MIPMILGLLAGLGPELEAVSESLALTALALAVLDLVLVIALIRFARRARGVELYMEPLTEAE